jgi:hypothetical protein
MQGGHDFGTAVASSASQFNTATANASNISPSRLEKPDDKSHGCCSAGRTVLAALLGLFAATFFSAGASAQTIMFLIGIGGPYGLPASVQAMAMDGLTGNPCNGGTVNVSVNGVGKVGSAPMTQGTAFVELQTLAVGTYSGTGSYSGGSNCGSANSTFSNLVITKANTTVTLGSTSNPSVVGQSVFLSAMVSGLFPPAPGNLLTLSVDGVVVATGSLGIVGIGFTTSTLAVGTHTLVGNFQGDSNYNGSSASGAQVVNIRSAHDFNADGKSDIVWRDTAGNVAFWLMNGATALSSGGVGGVPSFLSIVGQRDFNGDGKADLLWRDLDGNTAMWFMNGTTVASSASVGNIPPNWSVVGTGDFNGDGFGDILWTDGSGNYAVWLMNGATVSSSGGLGNVPTTWAVVGTGDFNGDGKTDLLWRDNQGNTSIWFMNGTQVASSGAVGNISTSWTVVGTGDFDGNGKSDIVWRHTSGITSIWLMNGATVATAGALGTVPTTYSIAQTGDYNGDGMSDLLWRDTSGNTSIWFMNGTTVSSSASVGNIPTSWTVQSTNSE